MSPTRRPGNVMGDRPDGLAVVANADSSFATANLALLQLQYPGDAIAASVSPSAADGAAIDPAARPSHGDHDSGTAEIHDVVFIDSRVPDIQDLLNGLKPGEKAFVIDAGSDGLDQVASILKTGHLANLTGIQIVSHGAAGALELGTTMLNDSNLSVHANALASIGSALASGGDLSLYACNTAAGATGQQFIADLSLLAGVDVAAATHNVGSADLGGSWTLDASTGPAPTSAPFTDAALSVFHDVLAAGPSVSTSGPTPSFTGGGAPQPLDPTLTLSDSTSTTLESATVSIAAGTFLGGDLLNFADQNGIRGFYDPFGGVLTLIGHATLAQYQTALRSITYGDDSDPTGGGSHTSRTIDWVVNDGTLSSAVATSTITTAHVAPTVAVGASPTATFNGGGAAVPLDAGLTVTDVGNLIGASVQLVGHLNGDTLNFVNTSHIQGSYNSTTGVLTLSGTDTVADYQTALDSVTYSFSPANGDPTFGGTQTSRSIYWVVNDGNTVSGTNEVPASPASSFNNDQPTIGLNQFVVLQGLFPGRVDNGSTTDGGGIPLGALRTSAAEFAIPWGGTVEADGQVLQINSNLPLFSVLSTNYGGNGATSFGLPDLQGLLAVGNEGSPNNQLGQSFGSDDVTLTIANQPQRWGGGGQGFDNDQPSQVINYIINTAGGLPGSSANTADLAGEVVPFLGNFAPIGYLLAAGQTLNIADYGNLFNVIGTTYGGDGVFTFKLPDLTGRTIIGAGSDGIVTPVSLGATAGQDSTLVATSNLPLPQGSDLPISNGQPSLALTYLIATQGIFPSTSGSAFSQAAYLGEIIAFAGSDPSLAQMLAHGWAVAAGQLLQINTNLALFSLLGNTYGGNGQTTFALPDLVGRAIAGVGGGGPNPVSLG